MATILQNLMDVANQGTSEQEIQTAQPADFNLQTPNTLNIQELPKGFGSYLQNILPDDIAAAAGAFSRTMQQIKNIEGVPIEKFAQVGGTMETAKGLDLINGTNVPTNKPEAQAGLILTALGSGPYNTYTYSDFFGCMSCLPYPWKNIQSLLQTLQTPKLFNIYNQLFLAVTWETGEVSIVQNIYNVMVQPYIPPTVDPDDPGQPRIDNWFYAVSSSLIDSGGGYGRGTAPVPVLTLTPNFCGASASVLSIGTDDSTAASMGGGTFGRITNYAFSPGSPYLYTTTSVSQAGPPATPTPPTEYITIQSPPTGTLAVQSNGSIATGGTNTAGTTYNSTGGRTINEPGWPGMNTVVQQYIDQSNTEILSIRNNNPTVASALNTLWDGIGQQLTIEQRARTIGLGSFPTPNTPPSTREENLNPYPVTMYSFTDGVYKYAQNTDPHMSAQTLEAISNTDIITGQSTVGLMRESRNKDRLLKAGLILDNTISDIVPPGLQPPLLANGSVTYTLPDSDVPLTTLPAYPANVEPAGYYNTSDDQYYVALGITGTGDINNGGAANGTGTINGIGTPLDTGGPAAPGSLAESPYQQLIPVNLNPYYTSGILLPATYSVAEAIDQVITCNCDCWVH